MKKEQIYTETNAAGEYTLLKVDTFKKEYELLDNLSEDKIEIDSADFIAPDLFDALLIGLKTKKYRKI
jgi:hypothetical protein